MAVLAPGLWETLRDTEMPGGQEVGDYPVSRALPPNPASQRPQLDWESCPRAALCCSWGQPRASGYQVCDNCSRKPVLQAAPRMTRAPGDGWPLLPPGCDDNTPNPCRPGRTWISKSNCVVKGRTRFLPGSQREEPSQGCNAPGGHKNLARPPWGPHRPRPSVSCSQATAVSRP